MKLRADTKMNLWAALAQWASDHTLTEGVRSQFAGLMHDLEQAQGPVHIELSPTTECQLPRKVSGETARFAANAITHDLAKYPELGDDEITRLRDDFERIARASDD